MVSNRGVDVQFSVSSASDFVYMMASDNVACVFSPSFTHLCTSRYAAIKNGTYRKSEVFVYECLDIADLTTAQKTILFMMGVPIYDESAERIYEPVHIGDKLIFDIEYSDFEIPSSKGYTLPEQNYVTYGIPVHADSKYNKQYIDEFLDITNNGTVQLFEPSPLEHLSAKRKEITNKVLVIAAVAVVLMLATLFISWLRAPSSVDGDGNPIRLIDRILGIVN